MTVVVSVAAGGCVVEDDGVDSKTITPKPEKQAIRFGSLHIFCITVISIIIAIVTVALVIVIGRRQCRLRSSIGVLIIFNSTYSLSAVS